MNETTFVFNVGAGALLVGLVAFFGALLGIVWKGKKEISDTIKTELGPINTTMVRSSSAITEIQTILRNKFDGLVITNSLLEQPGSPLGPTEYGAKLIKDSGLEKVLDDNKDNLCIKLKATLPKEYTEYDVQEKARVLLQSLKDDPIMNPVKEWIYNNPIEIETILRVGGLWLRDDFLKVPRTINVTNKRVEEK